MPPLNEGRKHSRYEAALVMIFICTLPLLNPWVRGDGVGYYAYARAPLIQHNLHFEKDWLEANTTFRMSRTDENGNLKIDQYTRTGYLDNHFAVGPAMLWGPFLLAAHGAVLTADAMGAHIPADGFSRPYRVTMALATALYGFLGLFLSFRMARKYYDERWAFLATTGIWFASSLPVYMYFNPSWSHAHSAFAVALFVWYWDRTRELRTLKQWGALGLLGGLMINVYYPNGVLLVLPLLDALATYREVWSRSTVRWRQLQHAFAAHLLFAVVVAFALLPTLITKRIIYGSSLQFGYGERWFWTSPELIRVLLSSEHGLISWTPILFVSLCGLIFLFLRNKRIGWPMILAFSLFYYLIASYQNWDGMSSFGNRFFVSLTPLFVLGLAAALEGFARLVHYSRSALPVASMVIALLVIWDAGFIFQWGTHMIPARGPISWREMAYNQFEVVPARAAGSIKKYFLSRREMMGHIEQEDVKQIKGQTPKEKNRKP